MLIEAVIENDIIHGQIETIVQTGLECIEEGRMSGRVKKDGKHESGFGGPDKGSQKRQKPIALYCLFYSSLMWAKIRITENS